MIIHGLNGGFSTKGEPDDENEEEGIPIAAELKKDLHMVTCADDTQLIAEGLANLAKKNRHLCRDSSGKQYETE